MTDRCNLRCHYCMPEEDYTWLPRKDLLSFEEISRLVSLFTDLGVEKLRLTGGEPLLRKDLPRLISLLGENERLTDLALTTNGVLLAEQAEPLRSAGLHRVTVSLDTLRANRFRDLARRDHLDAVTQGIQRVAELGFGELKLDTVVIRGVNDDEIVDLLEFAASVGAEPRFIEYMDVGGATRWSMERVVPKSEILKVIETHFGDVEHLPRRDWAPARRFQLPGGERFGIIASTTEPFCSTCDRSRLTADGLWYLCLYAATGHDLRAKLRAESTDEQIRQTLRDIWTSRDARGAEERKDMADARAPVSIERLRSDPHLEMHTRGG